MKLLAAILIALLVCVHAGFLKFESKEDKAAKRLKRLTLLNRALFAIDKDYCSGSVEDLISAGKNLSKHLKSPLIHAWTAVTKTAYAYSAKKENCEKVTKHYAAQIAALKTPNFDEKNLAKSITNEGLEKYESLDEKEQVKKAVRLAFDQICENLLKNHVCERQENVETPLGVGLRNSLLSLLVGGLQKGVSRTNFFCNNKRCTTCFANTSEAEEDFKKWRDVICEISKVPDEFKPEGMARIVNAFGCEKPVN